MTVLSEKPEANNLCGYVMGGEQDTAMASGWRLNQLTASRLSLPCSLLLGMLLGIALVALLMPLFPAAQPVLVLLQLALVFGGVMQLRRMLRRMRVNVLEPLEHLRQWARVMRSGKLSARVPVPESGEFADLARDINLLGERLEALTHEMDERVRKQTTRLAHQTRSLAILYEVAASINKYRDLDDLLTHFLHTLRDVTDARAATVRLLGQDKKMRLVASLGLDDEVVRREQQISLEESCICGIALSAGTIQCRSDIRECNAIIGMPFFADDERVTLLAVPLQYRGKDLGIYNLFLDEAGVAISRDFTELLTSIGRHLGMAIEKAYLDNQAQRMSIMQERTMFAHELHDSLAQTLASLRYQVKMLDDTLAQGSLDKACHENERIRHSLDEAHTELRQLLHHFRAPLEGAGLVPTLKSMVERFRAQSGISTFFQHQCADLQIPAILELQVVRIIQEALANIRKHSRAQTVRILLSCDSEGHYRALIEDDGVGIGEVLDGEPGEHVGLSIMQERAQRLGGVLRIESEPGEGTRIELTFRQPANELEVAMPTLARSKEEHARPRH
ncbi:MAG TPA: ATP-binding protein [Gammaproteobacteria bacterium]